MISFVAAAIVSAVTVVAAIVPPINPPATPRDDGQLFPAPPGYLLPWAGGEIHTVTQGEETTFTHNRALAYAYDFDMSYETVVAARSGKVTMLREDSNLGGCNAMFNSATNYLLIDHGDGTSSLYLHLAHNSVEVNVGDVVAQGEPVAISGETGVTCGHDGGPGAHLHFQVQRTVEGVPLSQSVPIAFDDIPTNKGVPVEGRAYASGNYGPGKEQKIKLTPWRVQRVFNPQAQPENPLLSEGEVLPPPPPPGAEVAPGDAPVAEGDAPAWPTDTPQPGEWPTEDATATASRTPTPTRTPTPEPSPTESPPLTATPVPADTPQPTAEASVAATQALASETPPPPAELQETPPPSPGPTETPTP